MAAAVPCFLAGKSSQPKSVCGDRIYERERIEGSRVDEAKEAQKRYEGDGVFTGVVPSWIYFSAVPAAFAAGLAALFGLGHMVSNIGLGEGGSVSVLAPKPYFETDKETT